MNFKVKYPENIHLLNVHPVVANCIWFKYLRSNSWWLTDDSSLKEDAGGLSFALQNVQPRPALHRRNFQKVQWSFLARKAEPRISASFIGHYVYLLVRSNTHLVQHSLSTTGHPNVSGKQTSKSGMTVNSLYSLYCVIKVFPPFICS